MNIPRKSIFLPFIIGSFVLMLSACEEVVENTGTVGVEITDAPVDNTEVEAVFVTVADVTINGESYAGFEGKQTVNLMALQNGVTEILGSAELETGSYSSVSLVLDYETDENGVAPGCYVVDTLGEKYDLATSGQTTGTFTIFNDYNVRMNQQTDLVIDVDLRKAIKQTGSGADKSYEFVAESDFKNSLRLVGKTDAGTVQGSLDASVVGEGDKVVVYAYEKGSFDKDTETTANANGLMFSNAISSTTAVQSGNTWNFSLHFLQEGDYEVCYAVYDDPDEDGVLSFDGFLQSSLGLSGGILSEVNVDAGVSASLNIDILGILRL